MSQRQDTSSIVQGSEEGQYGMARLQLQLSKLQSKMRSQESQLHILSKEISLRAYQHQLNQSFALLSGVVTIQASLRKEMRLREWDESRSGHNDYILARKLQQMVECTRILAQTQHSTEKNLSTVQLQLTSALNEKVESLQSQLDDYKGQSIKEALEAADSTTNALNEVKNMVRETESKLEYKLSEVRGQVEGKVANSELESVMNSYRKEIEGSMRQYQLSCSIDPKRIDQIEKTIEGNRGEAVKAVTECSYNIQTIKKEIESKLVLNTLYHKDKHSIEKRLALFNYNLEDLLGRASALQKTTTANVRDISQCREGGDCNSKEINRINTILLNLKIGEQFQKMLQEMDPSKILQLQQTVDTLKLDYAGVHQEMVLSKRELARINACINIQDIVVPNSRGVSKETVVEALEQFLTDHHYQRKISMIENELREQQRNSIEIGEVKKVVNRIVKENQNYKIKSMEEDIRKNTIDIYNIKSTYNDGLSKQSRDNEKDKKQGKKQKKQVSIEKQKQKQKIHRIRSGKKIMAISSISMFRQTK